MEAAVKRAFRIRGLERDEGSAVLEVQGKALCAVEVSLGEAKLTTAIGGPARVVASFDSQQTLDAIIDGTLHPVVATLQNRVRVQHGDTRFGFSVLLGLRASAPRFAQRGS